MFYTDDPIADYDNYSRKLEEELEKLPRCVYCEEPIQDEYCYYLEGGLWCEECLKEQFRKPVEHYMDRW